MGALERLQAALPDRYRLERELGRGGMATVYLADDLKHHRKVALKVLKPELAASLGVERFLREIELSARLAHPHILSLHDSGSADGLLYYVMPYVEGESLRDRLTREKQLPVNEAVQIACEVADALAYAHAQGVIHRDIKPENVLLQSGHAVVADFGIARAVSAAGSSRLTETGLAVGTPAYMSPEQASGEPDVDARSDLYSLGCVLYEMLSGETPYTGRTPQAILAKKLTEPVPRVSVLRETVPASVEAALVRALAKAPVDRFATTEQFSQALTATSAEQGIAAVDALVRTPRRSKVLRRGAWGALVVLLGVAGWWGVHRAQQPTIRRLAVLPLASFTPDSTQQYFVEGVHEALIFDLQQAGVPVIGRTSVLQYAHTEKPVHEIARELGVDGIIEGSLLRAGDSVEIALRLIDARKEETRWQKSYSGDVGSMLALYHGVTRGIATEIRRTLDPQVSARLAVSRQVDPQVYDDYLQGQFYFRRLNPGDLDLAFEYFQRALQRDSTYAPAWAGIAQVWAGRSVTAAVPTSEATSKEIAAARHALELDSTLAEVQYAAALAQWADWDWAGTERAFQKAIEINPNYADVRGFYSHYLYIMERPEEARAQMDSALALDPLSALIHGLNGVELLDDGRAAEAANEFQKALDGGNVPLGMNIVQALAHAGHPEEALEQMRKVVFVGDQEALDALSSGYEAGGFQGAMRRLADLSAARPSAMSGGPFVVADWYALAGDAEHTLEWLERAVEIRDGNAAYIGKWADFAFVRQDPRFQALLRQMGLPT